LVLLLGETGERYLRKLADTDLSLSRQIKELFDLVRQYGPEPVAAGNQELAARQYKAIIWHSQPQREKKKPCAS
jgi:hypothetical protein